MLNENKFKNKRDERGCKMELVNLRNRVLEWVSKKIGVRKNDEEKKRVWELI